LGTVADGDLVISAEGPLGGLLAGGGLGGGSAPIMAGLLLPAITSAREKARTVESKNNMKQLATMCYAYEQDHGTFPPDLATLVREMGMSPKIMQSPLAPGNSNSYLYVRSSSGASSMQPVILEDPANYGWEKLVVIFADTHAEPSPIRPPLMPGGRRLRNWQPSTALPARPPGMNGKRPSKPAADLASPVLRTT
jgi:hypothetical protein